MISCSALRIVFPFREPYKRNVTSFGCNDEFKKALLGIISLFRLTCSSSNGPLDPGKSRLAIKTISSLISVAT